MKVTSGAWHSLGEACAGAQPFHWGRIVFQLLADLRCFRALWTLTRTKKAATKKKERDTERYQQGCLVKRNPETENLLFPGFVSCRGCEVNSFETKWVYEGVARRSSTVRLLGELPFAKISVKWNGFISFSCFSFYLLLSFFLGDRERLTTVPHFVLFSTLRDTIKTNDHIASSLSVFQKLRGGRGLSITLPRQPMVEWYVNEVLIGLPQSKQWAQRLGKAAATPGQALSTGCSALHGGARTPVLHAPWLAYRNGSILRRRNEVQGKREPPLEQVSLDACMTAPLRGPRQCSAELYEAGTPAGKLSPDFERAPGDCSAPSPSAVCSGSRRVVSSEPRRGRAAATADQRMSATAAGRSSSLHGPGILPDWLSTQSFSAFTLRVCRESMVPYVLLVEDVKSPVCCYSGDGEFWYP